MQAQDYSRIDSLNEAFSKTDEANEKAELLFALGKEYALTSPDTSIVYYEQALPFAIHSNDLALQSEICATLSHEFRYTDQVKSADYAIRAVELAEKTGDKRLMASAYASMGGHYMNNNDLEGAEDYVRKSLEISEELGDTLEVARRYNGLGIIYMLKAEYDVGEEYWLKSVEYKLAGGFRYNAASTMTNIAIYYKDIARYFEAKELLDSAIAIERDYGDFDGIAFTFRVKGEMYNLMENFHEALKCFDSSLYYYDKMGDDFIRMDAYIGKSHAYEGLGDYKRSLEYLKDYLKLAVKESNESQQRVREELESKFETEKKEEENKRLLAENNLKDSRLEEERSKIALQEANNRYLTLGLCAAVLIVIGIYFVLRRVRSAKLQVEEQKKIVEHKNQEITDSITYAKRLQEAILPSSKAIDSAIKDNFVLYLPKDIVAGDFYWMEVLEDRVLLAACDCTGHGVPGAMVSVVCHNALNRSVREFGLKDPGQILDKTTDLVIETFEKSGQEVKDGMDISLISLKKSGDSFGSLSYAGANNNLYLISQGELEEYKADKQPIGKYENRKPFTTSDIDLKKGDQVYLFTDGYADQFGGDKGKKMKYKPFKELLVKNQSKLLSDQRNELHNHFIAWMDEFEQVDDVCLIGVRV